MSTQSKPGDANRISGGDPTAGEPRRGIRAASQGFALLWAALLLAAALGSPVDHDEQMYVAAGVLARDHAVYRDFAFLQTPYQAWLGAALFSLDGGPSLLVRGRLMTWLALLWATLLLAGEARRRTGRAMVEAAVGTLFCLIAIQCLAAGAYWNKSTPVPLALAALLMLGDEHPRRQAVGGFFLALCIGLKLYYAVLLPLLLLCRRPAVAGLLLGLAPMLVAWLRAPEGFWFGNVEYHRLSGELNRQLGYLAADVSVWRRIGLQVEWLGLPWPLLLPPLALLPSACRAARTHRAARLALLAVGLTLPVPVLMRPTFSSYLALPLPCLGLAAIQAVGALREPWRTRSEGLAMMLLVLACVAWRGHLGNLAVLSSPGTWATSRVQRTGERLAAVCPAGRVATTVPLYALEAGRGIYPELASGVFALRVAGRIDAARQERLRIISPERLPALLEAEPPAAILTGFAAERQNWIGLDQPLVDYAEAHGYRPHRAEGWVLWRRGAGG